MLRRLPLALRRHGPLALADMRQQLDLTTPGACKLLAEWIKTDIDAYCTATFQGERRTHLGASLIGHECSRHLWYIFRWVKHELFEARMLRLFNRGHREEERFVEYLRGIGFEIHDVDTDGKQHRVSAVLGHFGGSFDGRGLSPGRYAVSERLLCEFKTKATGSGFNKLRELGVRVTNEQHYAQMCCYGVLYGFRFAIYMVVNKNDDDLHIEVVPLDHTIGAEYARRAEYVIMSPVAPARIAQQKTYWKCKMCPHSDICFDGAVVEHNCRSCKFAVPIANAEWHCNKWSATIPASEIPKGCTSHVPITDIPL